MMKQDQRTKQLVGLSVIRQGLIKMYSKKVYIASGQDTFTYSFDTIDTQYIKVYVNGVESDFSLIPPNSVKLDVTPAVGARVLIDRDTPIEETLVTFQDGSLTNENDFNTSDMQMLYAVQEMADRVYSTIELSDTDDKFDARSKVIKNLATPVNPTDAATKAYADGGNLVACQEQVVLAQEQATIATQQVGLAATQANIASDMAKLATDKAGGRRFSISGCVGGSDPFPLVASATSTRQIIPIPITEGQIVKIKNVRYYFNLAGLQLNVFGINSQNPGGPSLEWDSTEQYGSATLDFSLGTAFDPNFIVYVTISNITENPVNLTPLDSWWIDFNIETE